MKITGDFHFFFTSFASLKKLEASGWRSLDKV